MTYTKQIWYPLPAGGTLVSAVRLNKMETGIQDASDRLDVVETSVSSNATGLSTLSAQVGTLQTKVDALATSGGGSSGGSTGGTTTTVITKYDVGLGNVDNTSDLSKPVSTPQQTALNLKANLASPTFTGTVSGITKAMVGLGNADNTSDLAKPISTATQTALNLKANLNSPTFTGTVNGVTKTMVGLGSVDNTSDLQKISATGTLPTLYYNGTSWPGRIVPPGYVGPVVWNSETYANAPSPISPLDSDRWARKVAA